LGIGVSELLSEQAWLDRAARLLTAKYGRPKSGTWTADTALNAAFEYDSEKTSKAIWTIDPEKHVDFARIQGDFFQPSRLFGLSGRGIMVLVLPLLALVIVLEVLNADGEAWARFFDMEIRQPTSLVGILSLVGMMAVPGIGALVLMVRSRMGRVPVPVTDQHQRELLTLSMVARCRRPDLSDQRDQLTIERVG
jgi:hypothetical protein